MNLNELSEFENKLISEAPEIYGPYFDHASELIDYIATFITGIIDEESWIFLTFLGSVFNNLILALMSFIRRHDNQANVLIRLAIEAAILACYSLYKPKIDEFVFKQENGEFEDKRNVKDSAYKWFEKNYKEDSDRIKMLKKMINERHSHSNLGNSLSYIKFDKVKSQIQIGYFDNKDDKFYKGGILGLCVLSWELIIMFSKVIEKYQLVKIDDNFNEKMELFKKVNEKLMIPFRSQDI